MFNNEVMIADETEAALGAAIEAMPSHGITRVTDITRLDIVGVPVFAAIRPTSLTLAVNNGKGVNTSTARISAIMEAIEYSFAERIDEERVTFATPTEAYRQSQIPITAYCPVIGAKIDPDLRIGWVEAEDLLSGSMVLVPAEAVYMPCPAPYGSGFLRSNSCGLACGVTLENATIHGLLEVVERHQQSFDLVRPRSRPTALESLSGDGEWVARLIQDAGLSVRLRSREEYGLYYADAVVFSDRRSTVATINGGTGCHPTFDAAAKSALLEAVQSRLTVIHGGRDDLSERLSHASSLTPQEADKYQREILAPYYQGDLVEIERGRGVPNDASLPTVLEGLVRGGFRRILRYNLTSSEETVQAVRVVIPWMEHFSRMTMKMGVHLLDYVRGTEDAP